MAFRLSDEIVDNLIRMFENIRERQFEVGDYLIELVDTIGFEKTQLINYLAGILHISASTLYDYYRISKAWTPELREQYQYLDWTFYRNTNPENPEDLALLEQAIDEGWNVSRLKNEKYGINSHDTYILSLKSLCRRILEKEPEFSPQRGIIEQILSLIEQLDLVDEKVTELV